MAEPLKGNSVSFWNTFFTVCERRAFLNAVFPEQEEDKGEALLRGILIHTAFEDLCNAWLKLEFQGGPEGSQRWAVAFASLSLQDEQVNYIRRADEGGVLNAVTPIPGGVERWFAELNLGPHGTIPWRGKIDLVSATAPVVERGQVVDSQDRPCVVDWKTISSSEKIKTIRAARRELQLAVYCLATDIRTACFVYLLPHGAPVVVRVDFTETELDRHRRWIYDSYQVLKSRWDQLDDDLENWQEVFSLAAPGCGLCSPQWCRHFGRCLGDKGVDEFGHPH